MVTDALRGETLGKGSRVELLVSPDDVTHPREAQYARAQLLRSSLPWGLALGGALAVGLFWRELRRALRRELAPLRVGMLVWLTPDGPLPATRRELVFSGSYWKDDVKFEVRARARPGRAPVRNADKLLAAVLPAEPSWVRVIDEDLARALGWFER